MVLLDNLMAIFSNVLINSFIDYKTINITKRKLIYPNLKTSTTIDRN